MIEGGRYFEVHANYHEIPVFVKDGAIVPMAKPVDCVEKNTVFEMEIKVFGDKDGVFVLYDDDFETFDYEQGQNRVVIEKNVGQDLSIRSENGTVLRYSFVDRIN